MRLERGGGERKTIVVAGGGITGLSAAYYARKLLTERQIPADIVLVEKSGRLGGKIQTLRRDGFVIEQGPDSFLARKLPIIRLVRELGLEPDLIATNPHAKTSYILHKQKLHQMPLGLVLGIPTAVTPFIKTGLISPAGKLRAAMDLLLPAKKDTSDESLGSFIERRLGREVLEHITEPLLAGIYAGDTRSLSLQATFPQFKQLELKHRSLILGLLAGKKQAPPASELPEIARQSLFLTFRGGLATLVERLSESLQSVQPDRSEPFEQAMQTEQSMPSVRIITGQGVDRLEVGETGGQGDRGEQVGFEELGGQGERVGRGGLGGQGELDGQGESGGREGTAMSGGYGYRLRLDQGAELRADAVLLAVPAFEAAKLIATALPEEADWLQHITYTSVANIALAYRREDVRRPLDGSGFVVPRQERRMITACTWSSSKWLHAAPPGSVLLRTYVGRADSQEWMQMSDRELLVAVLADLRDTMGITAEPLFSEVTRCYRSMPQYPVGHREQLAQLTDRLQRWRPGLFLCGAGYEGVGLPDCIQQGRTAAERMLAYLERG